MEYTGTVNKNMFSSIVGSFAFKGIGMSDGWFWTLSAVYAVALIAVHALTPEMRTVMSIGLTVFLVLLYLQPAPQSIEALPAMLLMIPASAIAFAIGNWVEGIWLLPITLIFSFGVNLILLVWGDPRTADDYHRY